MKTISQIINEQIVSNPIVSDEEMNELKNPLSENEIFDDSLFDEEINLIDKLAKQYALTENRTDFINRVNNAITKLRIMNEQKCNNTDS